ncbi:HD domain-containing protein, partial [Streptomyces sp. NPDC054840]
MLELMKLLRADPDDRGLRTAALLRRSHPFDKELQIAGLVHCLGSLLRLSDGAVTVGVAAESIRPLLGERVARLVRLQSPHRSTEAHAGRHDAAGAEADPDAEAEAVATLCQARDSAAAAALDAGVLEDWQPLLDLVAAGCCRAGPPGTY